MVGKEASNVTFNDDDQPDAAWRGRTERSSIKGPEDSMRVATWNVGSMSRRSGEVVDVMKDRRVDVCCLQECRWKGGSSRWIGRMGARYKFFWQGSADGSAGVGVLVAEWLVDQMVSVTRICERVMAVKMVVGKRLINIFTAYAPQVGRTMEEKTEFWDKMHEVVATIPAGEMVILGGDLNRHVGKDADGYGGVHGGLGYGTRNAEGEVVLEFADAAEMVVGNTFRKPDNHLITYESGQSKTQIDYILVRSTDWAMVKDVKVIACEECVSQHRLVVADLRIRGRRSRRRRFVPRIKVWELKKDDLRKRFDDGVQSRAGEVLRARGQEEKWQTMKRVWLDVSTNVCGWTKGPARHKETWWWNDEVAIAVGAKKDRYAEWAASRNDADLELYRVVKRRARRVIWEAQEGKRTELAGDLAREEGRKSFFRIARQMARACMDVTVPTCLKDEDGNIVIEDGAVKEVWRGYMERLMNVENEWDGQVDL